jgi:hypothetical protein
MRKLTTTKDSCAEGVIVKKKKIKLAKKTCKNIKKNKNKYKNYT